MAKQNKFGTFGGVFVPSILTILGVIMYLRLPMIVGEAGLWATIGIIIVAHIISVTTGLSVSSIATDKKVEAGGTYYMISRSLGLPIGGTLGLALFVGLSFSVSLYLIGFSESFLSYWGFSTDINNIRLTGSIVLLAVTTLTFISTSLAMKTQYFIMAAIVLSLVSIFLGNHDYTPAIPVLTNSSSAIPLMVLFGIFFPAVTGFEAGVSMSGDLKDAKKSIPGGSIAAIVVGFVVYIGLASFFAFTVSGEALAGDSQVLLNIAWIPELVIAGIWGATLSSALGSIMGAPRILQATAVDKITPKFFGKGYGATNEPRNALLLTFVIAEMGILIGELDVIARVVSIFFITTYGFLNISAAFERWTGADFRPEFKIPVWISIVGAIACILVMIQLDFVAMLAAVLVLGLLFLYLKRKELTLDSGDAWSGVWASLVRTGLTNLKKDKLHNRNWRPNTIMFSGNPEMRNHMVEMGKAISGKLGILSAFELVESDDRILAKTESNLSEEKDSAGYFLHKLYCRSIYSGMDQIARVYGFSGVEPNTILMGWSKKPKNKEQFIDLLESFEQNKYNAIFLNYDKQRKFGNHRTIDIWWSGSGRNLSLAINLIRHLTNSQLWKNTVIRLMIINPDNDETENVYKTTSAILANYRVDAEVRIVNNEISPLTEKEIIEEESKDTDLVIMGIPDQKYHQLDKYYDQIDDVLSAVGTSLVINASDDFEELEVISVAKSKTKSMLDLSEINALEMPELKLSSYAEIADDMLKIDANGQKILELFHKKTFQPVIQDHLGLLNQLAERVKAIHKELAKISEIPDAYRKKKAFDKLKNDVFFKNNSLFANELKEQILPGQLTQFSEGINWYLNRLKEDFKKYPSKLKITYQNTDFGLKAVDSLSLKLLKRSKQFKSWILRQPITQRVNYREVARYYQLNSRIVFVNQILGRFEEEEMGFYQNLRKIVSAITMHLEHVERAIAEGSDVEQNMERLSEIGGLIDQELQSKQKSTVQYVGRLQLEFRKNLQLMSKELERVDVNQSIKKKKRSGKYYEGLMSTVTNFPEGYQLKIKTLLNMVLMELSVNATKNRMEVLQDGFHSRLRLSVNQKYLRQLAGIVEKINTEGKIPDIQKMKLAEGLEAEVLNGFNETSESMLSLTEAMPETLEIYSSKGEGQADHETINIPVARMAEHYLKARYEVVVEEQFEALLDALKRSMYTAKDLLNLTAFNIDNPSDGMNTTQMKEILADSVVKIEIEKADLEAKMDAYIKSAENQFETAFEPLSTLKIEESAGDFVYGLRNYQGQQVLHGVGKVADETSKFFKGLITKVLYVRSEGILFTKKFNKTNELVSFTSRLLDIREKVSPADTVLKSLPSYYVTLFNGKSNISNDFWIPRVAEEKAFNLAFKRYQEGFKGGILVIGERNSGKTAFSKYCAQRYLKGHTVYSVFASLQPNATVEGFTQSLSKATQKRGNADQILNSLPVGSVVMINDLELFWERDSSGLDVVRLIERLIDAYGHKVLFVVNLNPFAYKLINQLTGFGQRFIEIINFTAFDAEELKDLIVKRHRSSGLSIGYDQNRTDLNEVQLARLFNAYFDYSAGNPGTALNGWLAYVKKTISGGIVIQKPSPPSTIALKELDEDWMMLVTQFVLHKRMMLHSLVSVTGWDELQVESAIKALLRSGLVVEKTAGVYQLDPFMYPFVVKSLQEKEVL